MMLSRVWTAVRHGAGLLVVAVLLAGCPAADAGNPATENQAPISKRAFLLQLAGICADVNREVSQVEERLRAGTTAEGLERVARDAAADQAPAEDRIGLNAFVAALLTAASTLRAQQAALDVGADTESELEARAGAAVKAANEAGMAYGMPDLNKCQEFVDAGGTVPAPSGESDDQDASAAAGGEVTTYLASPRLESTLKVGGPVGGVAASSDGRAVYVAAIAAKQILVVDVATRAVSSRIDMPARPRTLTVSPDGTRLWVVLFGDQGDPVTGKPKGDSVIWVDLLTRHQSPRIKLGSDVYGVTVVPDGTRVLCADHDAAKVSVLDVATGRVSTVEVAPNPHAVVVTTDGRKAYAADHESNVVQVFDPLGLTAGRTIEVGRSPHSVAVSPDDSTLYVANYDSNTLSVIDIRTDTVVGEPIPVGAKPQAVVFTPDGSRALVVNNEDDSVTTIDTRTRKVLGTVAVGDSPTAVALGDKGRLAFVSNLRAGTVSVLRLVE